MGEAECERKHSLYVYFWLFAQHLRNSQCRDRKKRNPSGRDDILDVGSKKARYNPLGHHNL